MSLELTYFQNNMHSTGLAGYSGMADEYNGSYDDIREATINALFEPPPYPCNLKNCTNLQSLSYNGNSFPHSFSFLVNLNTLILNFMSSDSGSFLSEGLNKMSSLTHLELSNINLINSHQGCNLSLVHLTALQVLALKRTNLSHVPPGIDGLTNLEQLNLQHNRLTAFTISENNRNLRLLALSNNRLTTIEFPKNPFTTLTNLDLKDNENLTITAIMLDQVPNLTSLTTSQKSPTLIHSSITHLILNKSFALLDNYPHITHLELLKVDTSDYPESLEFLTALQTLRIMNNSELQGLPEYFASFQNLEELDLDFTKEVKSEIIHQLVNLKKITAYKLTVPLNLDKLPLLEKAIVNHVVIQSVHESLFDLDVTELLDKKLIPDESEIYEIDRMIGLLPRLSRFRIKIRAQDEIKLWNVVNSTNLLFIILFNDDMVTDPAYLASSTRNLLTNNQTRQKTLQDLAKGSPGYFSW